MLGRHLRVLPLRHRDLGGSRRARIALCITKAESGGAQTHVRALLEHLIADDLFEVTLYVGEDGWLRQEALALAVDVRLLLGLSPGSPLAAWRGVCAVRRQLLDDDIDLVHAHSSVAGAIARLAAAGARIPAVFTAHGWAFTEGARPMRRAAAVVAESLLGHITRTVIVVSQYDYRLARRYHVVAERRMRVIPNAIAETAAVRAAAEPSKCAIVMTARFAPPKNHALLIEALAGVQGEWTCDLIGSGPSMDDARGAVDRRGLRGRIRFVGEQTDVADRLAAADVFVLASDYEGMPISIIEAMRAGLAVVASRVGGIPELVVDGVSGWLFDHQNVLQLRSALQEAVSNPAGRRRRGDAGRARYKELFTVDRMVERTRAVWIGALSGPSHRRRNGSSAR